MTLYQIDAFTDTLFKGNPAAVIPLDYWIDDALMQNIAMENNLAETAFICPYFAASKVSPTGGDIEGAGASADFDIRWFTPVSEIDLCGHATLASAYVLFNIMNFHKEEITLSCKSGILKVKKEGETIWMDFPSWKPERFNDYPPELQQALGGSEIVGVYKHRDLLVELMNEESVRKCNPDFALINKTGYKVIITAPGKDVDFVSRFFAPTVGVNEDPVTGSAHSQLIPFWSDKLGKQKLSAHQLSQRGGVLMCEQDGDRVNMGGSCVFYMKGEIEV
ncbi:MAG: PhzF family phenazine biosynthesis protein [Chitinophagaceae bacterium]